jgi:hypothetical protein
MVGVGSYLFLFHEGNSAACKTFESVLGGVQSRDALFQAVIHVPRSRLDPPSSAAAKSRVGPKIHSVTTPMNGKER